MVPEPVILKPAQPWPCLTIILSVLFFGVNFLQLPASHKITVAFPFEGLQFL